MLTVFFDSSLISASWPDSEKGILSEGDAKREAMRRKKPDLWRGENDRSIMTMLRHIPPF
jgi:hypothetical protein